MTALIKRAADKPLIDFTKGFEWFVPYVYDDKVPPKKGAYPRWIPGIPVKGTLTVLYGHTDAAKHPLKIADCVGKTFDEPFGSEVLNVDMDECEADVNRLVKVPITQGIFRALTDFDFNCGPGALVNIVRRVNTGNLDEARAALDLYVYSAGERMLGLQRRRDGEQALWDALDVIIPTAITHHTANVDLHYDPMFVQAKLKELGFYKDVIDGLIGPNTVDAMGAYLAEQTTSMAVVA